MIENNISDIIFIAVVAGCFFASFINAAFAIGGSVLMLAVSASLLPVYAVIPLHPAFLISSSITRSIYFRSSIVKDIAISFFLGCIIGTLLGSRIYIEIPETYISFIIAIVLLVSTWGPTINWQKLPKYPFFYIGALHSLISTLFAHGAFLQAFILHTKLNKLQISGTVAISLLVMSIIKVGGYSLYGFDYRPWLNLIIATSIAGILGAMIGQRIIHKISDGQFRLVFKIIMTLFALRLLNKSIVDFI